MRVTSQRLGLLPLLAGLVLWAGAPGPARAQSVKLDGATKLEARYVATLAGIPIGRGAWVVEVADDQFTAAASGTTAGVMRVFSSGQGTSAARGSISAGRLIPSAYASNVSADKKRDEVRMTMAGGAIRDTAANPPPYPDPERIPLTDAHRRGVVDPMTASLVQVTGEGDPMSREACGRTVPIFDGRIRYDLRSEFKRMDKVKAERGYQGPVVVCAVYFEPVAGYIPDRAAIKYLSGQKDMEVWLAPIAGTRMLVPFRMEIPTPLGHGILEAKEFVISPRVAAASRTQ